MSADGKIALPSRKQTRISNEEDIKRFFASIKDNPPKSIHTWLAAVKSFLIENDVELPQKFWKRLSRRIRGSRAVTEDIVPLMHS